MARINMGKGRVINVEADAAMAGYMDPDWSDGWPLNKSGEPSATALNPATWTEERLYCTNLRRRYDRSIGSVDTGDPECLESIASAIGLNAWGTGKFDKESVVNSILDHWSMLKERAGWEDVVASHLKKKRFDGWEDAQSRLTRVPIVDDEPELVDEFDAFMEEPEPLEYEEDEIMVPEIVKEPEPSPVASRTLRITIEAVITGIEEV